MINELCHYGVSGMKWGHRKQYVPIGRHRYVNGEPVNEYVSPTSTSASSTARYQTTYATTQYGGNSTPKMSNRQKAKMGEILAGTTIASHGNKKYDPKVGSIINSNKPRSILDDAGFRDFGKDW